MPVIATFYGIVIRMYFQRSEHNPPHVHASCGEGAAIIGIDPVRLLRGSMPPKELAMVMERASRHQEELIAMWKTQKFGKISPLE